MKQYPKLTQFQRSSTIAESQQFYDTVVVDSELQDATVKSIGEELSTISEKKLEYVINYINRLVTEKVESSDDIADATAFNKMKGYVAGLKDIKRLFNDALQAKRK
jgi:uncharacterized protein (UPF0335 family)